MSDEIGIWIDTRYHRIRVYKGTLKALGNPEYIEFGIGKRTKQIGIAASDKNNREALRVDYSEYIHSKPLFDGLLKYVCPLAKGTYRLPGELINGVVICPLPKMENDNVEE